ncbi:MAG: tetratricopeptide repeat protein [Flavobacteriales bacterium]
MRASSFNALALLLIAGFLLPACTPQGSGTDANSASDTSANPLLALEQRILADPNNAVLFAQRARYYLSIDSLRLAENDLRRAMAIAPQAPEWPLELADLYYSRIQLLEAEELLQQAADLDTNRVEALLKLSELKLVQRDYKDAMQLANQALRKEVTNAQGYFLKGWIHKEAGDTALAISSFRTAVEQDPDFYDAYIALGLLHAAQHDPLALQYYNTAIELRPNSVEALYNKGIYCQEHGLDSLALVCYDRIKEVAPQNAMAYYNAGYVLLTARGDTRKARAEFDRSIALLPTNANTYYNRGLTYEQDGLLDSALTDYLRALRLEPDADLPAKGLSRLQRKGVKVVKP